MADDISGSGPVRLTSSGSGWGGCVLNHLRMKMPTAVAAKPPTNNITGGGTSKA
jgi:hypothetical protein